MTTRFVKRRSWPPLLLLLTIVGSAGCAGHGSAQVDPAPGHPRPVVARDNATRSPAEEQERSAVRRAILDYVEGFYEGDSIKFVRSVWPEVRKYGYWRDSPNTAYTGRALPYSEFLRIAEDVRARNSQMPPDAPKDIVIYEVQDQTASAKLTASWGTDYLLLAKEDGRWMITHVLWQGPLSPVP